MRVNDVTDCRVFDVQRFSIHDGPGIRTTVFFEGCPLRCAWCQNPEAFLTGEADVMSPEAVVNEVLKDEDFYAVSGGGITLSGGEPLLRLAPAKALLEEAKRRGLHTCVQTCGAVPQVTLEAVAGLVDLFQFDLKHMDSARHQQLTGKGNELIHRNAAYLVSRGCNVQFRMPVIPGVNDDATNVEMLASFLHSLGVKQVALIPYHRLYLSKYQALGLRPTLAHIEPATQAGLDRLASVLSNKCIVGTREASAA